jgi:hypothetical protein
MRAWPVVVVGALLPIWLATDAPLVAGVSVALLGPYGGLTAVRGHRKFAWYTVMHLGMLEMRAHRLLTPNTKPSETAAGNEFVRNLRLACAQDWTTRAVQVGLARFVLLEARNHMLLEHDPPGPLQGGGIRFSERMSPIPNGQYLIVTPSP